MQRVWVWRAAPVLIMRHSKKYTKFCCNPTWQHSCTFCSACSVALSLLLNLSLDSARLPYVPIALPHPRKKSLLLCHFLTAFVLKTKSCEPSACTTSAELKVAGTETGHRRQFAHPLGLLICLFHEDHMGFPYKAATDWQVLFWHRNIIHPGIGFESPLSASERTQT